LAPETPVVEAAPPAQHSLERSLPRNMLIDQRNFWTAPLRLRLRDTRWLVPLAGITAGLIASDDRIESELPSSLRLRRNSQDFSKYGTLAFGGLVGGGYVWGKLTDNPRLSNTAVLSGEAAANTFLITAALKFATGRDRPLEGDGTGQFRQGGRSFPSEHSAAAWAIASVIAREYPGPLTQLAAYGAASAITASRLTGRNHFASDVFVGSALGWFVGRQVYNAHRDPEVASGRWGTFEPARGERGRDVSMMGSVYVPLDSWVYAAFDRLAALGYVRSGMAGMRPWTRTECARLVEEASEQLDNEESGPASQLVSALESEFAGDTRRLAGERNLGADLESVYLRFTGISGPPLTDGYHFGQTIYNDFGRSYAEGGNLITGVSGRATAGPLAFYVRGEYQHAPGRPALSDTVRQTIAALDHTPLQPATGFAQTDRLELLDAYVAFNFKNNQLSFGKQSLWWGPGHGGPLLFSDNAEPVTMFRLSRVSPFTLPWMFKLMGPVRTELFWGQVSGQHFIYPEVAKVDPQPFVHGYKISFKPTPNLEFGVSKTTVWGGPGVPITARTIYRSLFSFGQSDTALALDPGDRRSGFDFSYRLPGLRKWLVLYNDAMSEDEMSPIGYPRRSAMNPGIYMPQLPKLRRLDLRVEGVYTDLPGFRGKGEYYENASRYLSGYTNRGMLMANWVGRQGQGVQAWSNYWFAPQKALHVSYRHAKVSPGFLPGGGTLNDYAAGAEWIFHPGLRVSGGVQYESWNFPVLAPTQKSNVSSTIQFTFSPGGPK
jgi:membrane-associated phospholipid phosphatase